MKQLFPMALSLALLLSLTARVSGSPDRAAVSVVLDGQALALEGRNIDGQTMAPLRGLAEALGLAVYWDGSTQTAYLSSGAEVPVPAPRRVVLDPGHGGSSQGAEYQGVKESTLNLAIAQKTAEALRREGVDVVMTRTEDTELSLYARTELARQEGADLFVSIHCNASTTTDDAQGIYTAYHPNLPGSQLLAEVLQEAMMASSGGADMGVEERPDLAVLRTADMPAALVECGFMSTPRELMMLQDEGYQERLAEGIAQGVLTCLTLLA